MKKTRSYTSQYRKKRKNLLNQNLQNHLQQLQQYLTQSFNHTAPTRSEHGKQKPQNIIQNENASNKTINIKTNSKHIGHLIAKTLKKTFGKN
jgi:hypothetical protein